ncbi:dynein regulatory complex protein 8 isoform X31 [Rattus norvegicus]|uniref:dynein regulatory complex protein 8 isoform X31 n=1 Tax=Rattus norvegicus TaxID=10116 RepID=UPI002FD8612D
MGSPRRRAPHQDGGGKGPGEYREIGTIIRSLGCSPTEGELHDFIAEVEEEEPTGYIRFEKFIPVMTTVLLEKRYRPIAEDVLLRAFEASLFPKRKWKKCCLLQLILNQTPLITETT